MSLREMKWDELKVLVFPGRWEMGAFSAKEAAGYIKKLGREQEEINILFAAAPSQNEFLEALAKEPDVPWNQVNAMQLDDYVGIHAKAPQRFANYLEEHIFSKVQLRKRYLIDCENRDVEEERKRYSEILQRYPADIAFIGIGENGHIAFNDPGKADFCDGLWMKAVELDLQSRKQQVHDGCFEHLEQVPKLALTVTIPPIMRAGRIFCMVPGKSKAEAVRNTLYAEIGSDIPSTVLRTHPDATLYLDEEGASGLL